MAEARKVCRAKVTRLQIRNLWDFVQQAKAGNRSQEDWLAAANRELERDALVKVGIAKAQYLDMKDPDQVVDLRLSYSAAAGVKLALIQGAAGASFRIRTFIREAADGFGPEFSKLVRKLICLPESQDLEEDKELEGVPFEDEPAPVEAKKES